MERNLLKKAGRVLCEGVAARVRNHERKAIQVVMCSILQASKSGYYKWRNREPSKRVREEGRLEVKIKAAHNLSVQNRCVCFCLLPNVLVDLGCAKGNFLRKGGKIHERQ
jgi:hypothetical protein